MKQNFEWNDTKEMKNIRKHGIDFQEAMTVFRDEFSLTFDDFTHSSDEERFIDIGRSSKGKLLVVVYTERGNDIRIISCRKATPAEKKVYEAQDN